MILGLTGGIASGKSTASNFLRELGYEIVDADRIAHEILDHPQCREKLVETFGREILGRDGKINRKILGEKALGSREELRKLNAIVHPAVIAELERRKAAVPEKKLVIFDIPLLFEVNLQYLCDRILLIYTDRETQIKRAITRDGSDRERIMKIIDSQADVEEKIRKSHYVIDNSEDIGQLKSKIRKVIDLLERDVEIEK